MNNHAFGWWGLSIRTAQMMAEAQMVMAYRMMGMAGVWPVSPSENARMMSEKIPAFISASGAATSAAMSGKRPDQILEAALRPIGLKTRANSRRLGKETRR
ncbi:antifreeze protein [Silicimonas algicola]|uniref:Antifreeze protein n=1 Tax=Silicimonas algicola TaxID=1826607 RepID=A0A316G5B0_9RHOB|nr:antifreeze protein [Silicimonas algicola]AZQ68877.1 antifreeze protein [Silicimonas algicola]PWK56028.1 hypothetical protein C8D95_10593 [Silicimonas algicola]